MVHHTQNPNRPLTEQQELLAQNLAMGLPTARAVAAAGYENHNQRPTILKHPVFMKRLHQLRQRSLKRLDITVDSLIAELESARVGALLDCQYGVAVNATMKKAALLGLGIERKEVEHHIINKPAREFTEVIELEPSQWLAEFAPKTAIEHQSDDETRQ